MNKYALTLAVVFATASAMLPGYAHAADDAAAPRTMMVRTADLDLASSQGQATLASRISSAARSVCDNRSRSTDIQYDRCVVVAKASAKATSASLIATATARRAQIAAR